MSYFREEFVASSAAVRVRFGPGVRHMIAEENDPLGARRALILSPLQQADTAMDLAENGGAMAAGLFSRAAMHTPVEITEEALAHAQEIEADCRVTIGGGSTTDLGKAIA